MPHVIVAVSIIAAEFSGQWRKNSLRGKRKQAAVRHLIHAMTQRVVAAQHEAAELLGNPGLQS